MLELIKDKLCFQIMSAKECDGCYHFASKLTRFNPSNHNTDNRYLSPYVLIPWRLYSLYWNRSEMYYVIIELNFVFDWLIDWFHKGWIRDGSLHLGQLGPLYSLYAMIA